MHYSLVYGRENEPWNEKDMFSWTVISLVCSYNKEGSTNCATVSRIRRQQRILQNHSIDNHVTVPKRNKQQWQDQVLCKVYFAKRHYIKDITSPQQVRGMIQLTEGNFTTPETFQALISMSEGRTINIHRNEEKEIGRYRYLLKEPALSRYLATL